MNASDGTFRVRISRPLLRKVGGVLAAPSSFLYLCTSRPYHPRNPLQWLARWRIDNDTGGKITLVRQPPLFLSTLGSNIRCVGWHNHIDICWSKASSYFFCETAPPSFPACLSLPTPSPVRPLLPRSLDPEGQEYGDLVAERLVELVRSQPRESRDDLHR